MAGPKQISDPKFTRFTEDVGPNTIAADAIEGVTKVAVAGISSQQSISLDRKIKEQRDAFNALLADGVDENTAELGLGADSELGADLIDLSIDNLVANQDTKDLTVDLREITAMEGDLARATRAVEQGISPIRALEVNAEAITRRYIDRFPGLASQFQRVAQTALGTQNNLMTATMRAQQELFDAADAAIRSQQDDIDSLAQAAFDEGFVGGKVGATPEIRSNSIATYLAYKQLEQAAKVGQMQEEAAISRGEVPTAQRQFNTRVDKARNSATMILTSAITDVLPPEFQQNGPDGLKSYILATTPDQRVDTMDIMRLRKEDARLEVNRLLNHSGYISEAQRGQVNQLLDSFDRQWDVIINSLSQEELSAEMGYTLSALQTFHGIKFETLFGEQQLHMEKFLKVVPVDSSLYNQYARNFLEQGYIQRMFDAWGVSDITGASTPGAFDTGFDPKSPEGKELVSSVELAAIDAFRQVLADPESALTSFAPLTMTRGLDIQFKGMTPENKKNMLDMIGSEGWEDFVRNNDSVEMRETLNSIGNQVQEWGAIKLQDAVEDFVRDISDPAMNNRFGITSTPKLSTGQRLPGIAGITGVAGTPPIKAQDMVNMELANNERILFAPMTKSQYEAMGVDTDAANMSRINQMVSQLNLIHGQGLNAYARSMGNLGTGGSRAQVLLNIFDELNPPDRSQEVALPVTEIRGSDPRNTLLPATATQSPEEVNMRPQIEAPDLLAAQQEAEDEAIRAMSDEEYLKNFALAAGGEISTERMDQIVALGLLPSARRKKAKNN